MTAADADRRQRDADRTVARHHARTECAEIQAERDSYRDALVALVAQTHRLTAEIAGLHAALNVQEADRG